MLPRTLRSLDWDAVLDALALHARTKRGAAAARAVPLSTVATDVRARYAEVAEVMEARRFGDDVPVGGVADVAEAVERAARGAILEPADLREIGGTARALATLRDWASHRAERAPRLEGLAAPINVDPALLDVLEDAFDAGGELSDRTYPELGTLRRRAAQLKDRVRHTLDDILRSDEWAGLLQDRFVSERDGRFVVPVKMAARRGLGIVHDTSGSGETAFVEPAAVVELHNELKETEAELRRTERRILSELSGEVGRRHVPLLDSLAAATAMDLACARAGLGHQLRGEIPTVGTDGVLLLKRARHPLLALKMDPVPNDLALTPRQPALILTGPNAGGKTIALKTLGLCALLCRAAVPVPADEGSRVDLFDPILADVGDQQSVEGGLSTFSAHVGALREALAGARTGALVLLDEVAVGTDPAQGAALARAVLETVVEAGARVAVTTHYPELKTLASSDARFVVAAAQYEGGRPTYRMELGAPGPSYALAMARILGMPEPVLERAKTLLDDAQREMAERLEKLAEERAAWQSRVRELEARERELAERAARLQAAEQRLEREGRKAMEAETEAWKQRLKRREQQVKDLVRQLQAGGDLREANAALGQVRSALASASPAVTSLPEAPPLDAKVGDRVRVRSLGQLGTVVAAGEQIEVEVGRIRVRVPRTDLDTPGAVRERPKPKPLAPVDEGPPPEPARVRTVSNTCDMRGMRVDEALAAAERFLDQASRTRDRVAFLLHGHGTGALKQAVREWLPRAGSVKSWRPADAEEGGDAYTVVELK